MALPIETALHGPREDAVTFGQELLLQVLVATLGRHGNRERDQVQPAFHRLVDVANGGLVVACHKELELREELEEVLAHEARRDLVATGEVLELGLGPAFALFGFDGRNEARAAQSRHIGRVPVGARFHEGVHRRVGRVITQDGGQGVDEHRLAVRACAVKEEQRVLLRRPGQRVTDHPLQVGLQPLVATRDLFNELPPGRAVAAGRGCGDLGHPVCALVRAHPACLKIDHAARRVEQPRICIPFVGGGRVPAVCTRQTFHTADRSCAGQFGGDLGVVGAHSRLAADAADQVRGCQRVLGAPALTVPHQPLAPASHVSPVAVVAAGEGQRQRVLRTPDGFVAADDWINVIGHVVHLKARSVGEEGGDIEALSDGIGHVPALCCLFGRIEDVAGLGPRRQDRLCRLRGVLPARLVAVGPDQHSLSSQWRPVGLFDRSVRAVHRRGGIDARVDQGLRAFLALDQHHLRGAGHPWLVVERARVGWCHLAPLGIPGPELLLLSGRVVAVDDGDEMALGVEIVPLRGGWAKFIDGHGAFAGSAHRHLAGATKQISCRIQHTIEVGVDVERRMPSDQGEDIAAIARRAIRPQPGLLAVQYHLEAVAGAAQHVPDQELAPASLASWEHRGQHRG